MTTSPTAARFRARLGDALRSAGGDPSQGASVLYRRAVGDPERREFPAERRSPIPWTAAPGGVAVIRLDLPGAEGASRSGIDDALAAARGAGHEWCIAVVTRPEDVAVLRELSFLPL